MPSTTPSSSHPAPDLWGLWRDLPRVSANTHLPQFAPYWESTLTRLRGELEQGPSLSGGGAGAIRAAAEQAQQHAFAYPLTGDAGHARRAAELLELVHAEPCAWNLVEHNEMYPQDTADLLTAEITKACTGAIGWVWPELNDEQRARYVAMVAERGGAAIYQGATAGCWWGSALNSNWTAVLNGGLAFAALLVLGAGGCRAGTCAADVLVRRPSGDSAGHRSPPYTEGDSAGHRSPPYREGDAAGHRSPPYTEGDSAGHGSPPYREGDAAGHRSPPYTEGDPAGHRSPPYRDAEAWLAFARARTLEMLDLAAEEGAGVEGAGYWLYCFGTLLDTVAAIRNVTGEDLLGHPFWRVCSRFLPYVALPDMSAWVNYADTAYAGLGGSAFFHGVAAGTGDGLAQWYGNEILRRHGGAGWKDLLCHDPAVPEQPLHREPTCRLFKSIHLASLRSGWEEDATFMLFKGGSNAWSHTHLDLNSFFLVSRGERLATEPGPEPYSLAYWHSIQPVVSTAHHNCIVVDGAHQRVPAQYAMSYDLEEAGDCYSRLCDHVSTDWLEMVRGDATTAYGDQLSRAWRDVVYLKPELFVIHDDLVGHPVRSQRNFEWLLHSECELHDCDGGVEARGERASLFIEPVFPHHWEHKYVSGRCIPHGEKPLHAVSLRPYWHHKWNVDPRRSPYPHWDPRGDEAPLFDNTCTFLVVLSAVSAGQAPRYALQALQCGSAKGVRLVGEGEEYWVLFNHARETVALGDLQTDAEKLVLRVGDSPAWAAVRVQTLRWQGRALVAGAVVQESSVG